MVLRKITETNTTVTLGWDPVDDVVEYRGTRKGYVRTDGTQRWAQAEPGATQMRFTKDEWYAVEALGRLDQGTYPAAPVPAPAVYPSVSRYPSEMI